MYTPELDADWYWEPYTGYHQHIPRATRQPYYRPIPLDPVIAQEGRQRILNALTTQIRELHKKRARLAAEPLPAVYMEPIMLAPDEVRPGDEVGYW